MKYSPIDKLFFIENRKKFTSQLLSESLAIFHSNDEMPRSGDQNFPFRQQPDLFWLCGIDQENTILMIAPEHPVPEYREILFLRKTNEHIAVWEGHKYTKEEARSASVFRIFTGQTNCRLLCQFLCIIHPMFILT